MDGYKVRIISSSKELSKREQLKLIDLSNAIKFDHVLEPGTPLVITPGFWAVVSVHNENSKGDKDYENYVIVDAAGTKYVTGSNSFWSSFQEIVEYMADEGEYEIEVYKLDSKNYSGKQFITCSIV